MFKNNKVILLVLLIILAFVGYRYFFKKDQNSDSSLVAESSQNSGQTIVGGDLLISLSKLKSLTLDTSFFNDAVFNGLSDFSVPIVSQEIGRNNPFSSIGGPSGAGSSSSSARKKQ